MNQIASSENASTDAATIEDRAGSASFVLTSHEFEHSGANLKLLRPALREGDEVIVLTASEPVRPPEASWFRVVSIPRRIGLHAAQPHSGRLSKRMGRLA